MIRPEAPTAVELLHIALTRFFAEGGQPAELIPYVRVTWRPSASP